MSMGGGVATKEEMKLVIGRRTRESGSEVRKRRRKLKVEEKRDLRLGGPDHRHRRKFG